ncbi:nuclease-related domain-containing DEAD/DEAH box helicase [Arthrobacter sp. Leaf69]|uniref:nuclease-related domain-containing DEAD/DEAH box helicase n=1 Tax=Arthrobacter sp. Leaf69 TaxID=1736232 RepID=UPI00138F657D|nr:NERD domain-containing protein [Arthrobacter sp. Leaf69]
MLAKETKSPGEVILFPKFESDAATRDWIVLHSLNIANHVSNLEGEADFLVIAPGRGIALVEVKAVQRIERKNGMWHMGNLPPTHRSPFDQANDAYRSIERSLKKKGINLEGIPFDSVVWFTHISRSHSIVDSPEWNRWDSLYSEDRRGSVGRAIADFLNIAEGHLRGKGRLVQPSNLDRRLANRIAEVLRPDFLRRQSADELRQDLTEELEEVLTEQLDALDVMEDNPRVLFMGPAGSGKTHLAKAAARKYAAEGKSGYLVCFNRNLSEHLRKELADVPGLEVGTIHGLLKRISGIPVPADVPHGWWDNEFIDAALEWLLAHDCARDYLLIDEAQDILRSRYLNVLDGMLHGELTNGRFLAFGDFDHQKIYTTEDIIAKFDLRVPETPVYRLHSNCRNLPKVGASVALFGRLDPGYKRYRRRDDGVMPKFKTYKNLLEAEDILIEAIRELTCEGFELKDIVVLSPRKKSVASEASNSWLNKRLVPYGSVANDSIAKFETIHSFKGLEAPCVIITDIDSKSSLRAIADLLYIGMSRSTMRTVVTGQASVLNQILPGVKA